MQCFPKDVSEIESHRVHIKKIPGPHTKSTQLDYLEMDPEIRIFKISPIGDTWAY